MYKHSIVFSDMTFGGNYNVNIEVINSDPTNYAGYGSFSFPNTMFPCNVEFKDDRVVENFDDYAECRSVESVEDCYFESAGENIYHLVLNCNQGSTYTFENLTINSDTVTQI